MDGVTLSILLPCLNARRFLDTRIERVSFGPDFLRLGGDRLDSYSKIFGAEMPGFMDLPKINITQSWVCEPV